MNEISPQERLKKLLVERLRPLTAAPVETAHTAGMHFHGRQLFSYCCFTAERLAQRTVAHPTIGIVLNGEKEFWLGDLGRRFQPGDVFVLPAGLELDIVNTPDERSGRYEALLVEIPHLPPALAQLPARPAPPPGDFNIRVSLNADLVDALTHAAITLATSDHAETLAEHRLTEILMLLRDDPAARCLFQASLSDRIGWMVLAEPSRRWTAEEIARKLGLGASTLRRRLTETDTSLRAVLAATRMQVAHSLLARGEANVTAAAEAAGYTSRSHFIRRFRSVYGVAPSAHRREASNSVE
jgi:AraC-like DNA-binding protein